MEFSDSFKDNASWPGAYNPTGDLWEVGWISMKGKPCQICHSDGLIQSVITRKEHNCCVHREVLEVLVSYILVEGVAGLSRTWGVRCGRNVVCTLSRA